MLNEYSKNNFSVVISAPSGAGKTTLINSIMKDQRFGFSVSTTTRSQREAEEKGKSYYFVSNDEFKEMIKAGEFVEWAMVHGNYYGTSKKEIDRIKADGKIPIFDVDVQGAKTLSEKIDDAVYIFIVPPSLEELNKRLQYRNTDPENQIKIRLGNAREEMTQFHLYDYIIVNDIIEDAIQRIKSVITAEFCKRDRISDNIKKLLEGKE